MKNNLTVDFGDITDKADALFNVHVQPAKCINLLVIELSYLWQKDQIVLY